MGAEGGCADVVCADLRVDLRAPRRRGAEIVRRPVPRRSGASGNNITDVRLYVSSGFAALAISPHVLTLRNQELLLVVELVVCWSANCTSRFLRGKLTVLVIVEVLQEHKEPVLVAAQNPRNLRWLVRVCHKDLSSISIVSRNLLKQRRLPGDIRALLSITSTVGIVTE